MNSVWKVPLLGLFTSTCLSTNNHSGLVLSYVTSLIRYLSEQEPGSFDCWFYETAKHTSKDSTLDAIVTSKRLSLIPKRILNSKGKLTGDLVNGLMSEAVHICTHVCTVPIILILQQDEVGCYRNPLVPKLQRAEFQFFEGGFTNFWLKSVTQRMFGAYRVDIVAKGYNIIQTNIGFYDMEPAWYVVVIGWTLGVISKNGTGGPLVARTTKQSMSLCYYRVPRVNVNKHRIA
ncbi:conserved hypothetical protein [Culex quinquefasciatus]|uniref:Uncharacterized protein n=1 Tax=Culex quinquefasciatus TaxID=7176 RepID=B0WAX4_CULQU|nr:conserved hypothetical protein [Culex quinquefasciatus]|eukprot:XP_001845858.1 conserved hypothetical protein [Culex quinquefasciatus]